MNHLTQLIHILSDGKFHSGEQMGFRLGITRSAIWKIVHQLSQYHLEIESVPGKGYRLISPLSLLQLAKIKRYIAVIHLKKIKKIEIKEILSSTNDFLRQLSSRKNQDIYFCLAEQQTAGRGRLGRCWFSPYGANLYLSLLCPFEQDMSDLAGLSLAVSTIIAETLKKMSVDEIELKWPNDLFYRRKKLGGVLIDVMSEANGLTYAVIGVGLNLNMPSHVELDQPWIDLQTIFGRMVDRNFIAGKLIDALIEGLDKFKESGLTHFMKLWEKHDMLINREITLQLHNKKLKGVMRGVNKSGQLLLENQLGELNAFSAGDVSIEK